jgi:hypothetical protein
MATRGRGARAGLSRMFRVEWVSPDGRKRSQSVRASGHHDAVRRVLPAVTVFEGRYEGSRGGGVLLSFGVDPYREGSGEVRDRVWVLELFDEESALMREVQPRRAAMKATARGIMGNPAPGAPGASNPPRAIAPWEHAYMIGWYDGMRGRWLNRMAAYHEWGDSTLSEWYMSGVAEGRIGSWDRVRVVARAIPQMVLRVGPRLGDIPRSLAEAKVFARWYAEHKAPPRSNPSRGRRLLAAMDAYYAGNPGIRGALAAYRTGRAVQRLRAEGVRLNPRRPASEGMHVDVIVGPGATHNPTHSGARRPVLIYDKVLAVVAQKGRRSRYPGEQFVHQFTSAPRVYGMPDGTLAIVPRGRRV